MISRRLHVRNLAAVLLAGTSCGCASSSSLSSCLTPVTAPSAPTTPVMLWNGIAAGLTPDAVHALTFEDARHAIHRVSGHFEMSAFYVQENEPVVVRVLFAGKPKRVTGVDIEGTRSPLERTALLAKWGPPRSRTSKDLLASPGGSAMLNDGGKRFRIWEWRQGPVAITFKDRVRPGYFLTSYRLS